MVLMCTLAVSLPLVAALAAGQAPLPSITAQWACNHDWWILRGEARQEQPGVEETSGETVSVRQLI